MLLFLLLSLLLSLSKLFKEDGRLSIELFVAVELLLHVVAIGAAFATVVSSLPLLLLLLECNCAQAARVEIKYQLAAWLLIRRPSAVGEELQALLLFIRICFDFVLFFDV